MAPGPSTAGLYRLWREQRPSNLRARIFTGFSHHTLTGRADVMNPVL
jgi:hypothetical protein